MIEFSFKHHKSKTNVIGNFMKYLSDAWHVSQKVDNWKYLWLVLSQGEDYFQT